MFVSVLGMEVISAQLLGILKVAGGSWTSSLRKLFAEQPSLHPTRRARLWFYILISWLFFVFCVFFIMEAKLAVLIVFPC